LCSSASLLSRSARFVSDFKIAVPLDKPPQTILGDVTQTI
jgi:hypothetical protein